MSSKVETIHLTESEALAKGHSRLVFQHPHHPDRLIKVIRPEVIDERFGSGAAWYKRLRRFGRYLSYVRETQEYLAGWASHGRELPFVQKIFGFEVTNLGLGLVMQAALDRDGKLAPTLKDIIIKGRFDARIVSLLDTFCDQLLEADIVVSDLNLLNIVLAYDHAEGDHFVLIDGIGNNSPLPFKSHFRFINRRSKRGRIGKMKGKIVKLIEQSGDTP